MEDITDADNMNTERVCKEFEIQDFAEYHSLYLLYADVFENFRKMYLKVYH